MKPIILPLLMVLIAPSVVLAQEIASPDRQIKVSVRLNDGMPSYSVNYKGQPVISASGLGLSMTDSTVYKRFRSMSSSGLTLVQDVYHSLNAKKSQ